MKHRHDAEFYRDVYNLQASRYNTTRYGYDGGAFARDAKNHVILDILRRYQLSDQSKELLDVASGTGRIAHAILENLACNMTAFDVSAAMLSINRRELNSAYSTRIRFQVGDMTEIPFGSEEFDAATLGSFLYLVPCNLYSHYTRGIYRVLKPGGLLICEVSNALNLHLGTFMKTMWHKHGRKLQIKSYVYPNLLKQLFRPFDVCEIIGVEYPISFLPISPRLRLTYFLGKTNPTRFLGGKMIVVLCKSPD
jgi:SAM-dependent methyltransferase